METTKKMKKTLLTLLLLLVTAIGFSQAKANYRRYGKLTTTEINAIDTTRADVIYVAFNETLGKEVINRRDGNGWVDRFPAGGGSDDQDASEVATDTSGFDGILDSSHTDVQSALEMLDEIDSRPYRDLSNVISGDASVILPLTNGRTTFTSTASAVTISLSGATLSQGWPMSLHLISNNASGTTFTFSLSGKDVNGNAGFSVFLANGEERTLHFVTMDSNTYRAINYPLGSGGTDDQTLAEVLAQGNDGGGAGINNLGVVNVTDLSASNSISGDGSAITSISSTNVNIQDGGGYYSSTGLEGALQEQGPRLLPIGGTAGQVLEKIDGTDYNVQWANPSGGDPDQTLSISGSEGQNINISGSGGNSIDITESVNDIVANMVIGNTETGIDVTYDDVGGKLNFDVTAGGTTPAPSVVEMTDGVAPTTAHISNPTNGTVNIINSTSSDKTIPLNNLNVGTINDSFFIGDRNTAGVTRVQEGTMTFADTPDKDGDAKGSNNAIEITDNTYVFFNEDIDGTPLPEGNFDWVTISTGPNLGPELVTNGTFNTDTDWTKQNGSTISGGEATVVGAGAIGATGGNHSLYQVLSTVNGTTYQISFDAERTVGSGNLYVSMWYDQPVIFNAQTSTGSKTTYTVQFVAQSNGRLVFGGPSGTTHVIDNVTVKEVLP